MRNVVPHLAAIAVIAGCVWLTLWQIDRAAEKREIIERWNSRTPAALESLQRPFALPQPVTGVGFWDPSRQLLIDNQIRAQRAGVFVLTPLKTQDGRIFLVNRGWAPWPARSAKLPNPDIAQAATEIRGVLNNPPGTGVRLGRTEIQSNADWPVLATYFDHDAITRLYGDQLQPSVIQLDPAHPAHLTGDPWKIVTFGPDRHIGYAMTWTSIAVVVAVLWLVLTVRQIRGRRRPTAALGRRDQ